MNAALRSQGDILFSWRANLSFLLLTHIFRIKYYFSKNNAYFCTRILKRVLIYYMVKDLLTPDYIFESSWEVCNKVGGIYTVLSTRANTLQEKFRDRIFFIGPDVWQGKENPLFIESDNLCAAWKSMHLRKTNFRFVSDDGIYQVSRLSF